MRDTYLFTINKHGKDIAMPPLQRTGPECMISKIFEDFGVHYQSGFYFDETGYRQYVFDFAVFKKNGDLAFLVEYDGPAHYSPEFYEKVGNRKERNLMHIVKSQFATTRKAQIAVEKKIPLLRVDSVYDKVIRYILMVWVWNFVDECKEKNHEISSVMMMDKYGWDFSYVHQFEPSKKVQAFLDSRNSFIDSHGNINKDNWEEFYGDLQGVD